jgi:GntR family transcriptional repressor for pyruvate dehydrogenase complex
MHPHKAPPDITAKLLASFKNLISDGTFAPGCKLPPERELARRFGVNRSSLRQALKVLQLMGVLSQRVGDGTYLSGDAAHVLREPIEFLILMGDISDEELFDARMIVESELAARAAERATTQDLKALRKAIDEMDASRSDQARIEADLAFHEAIFQASGNRVCRLIFTVIHRAILRSMSHVVTRAAVKRPLSYHRAIYAAINERNPDEARRQMTEHIVDAKSMLFPPSSRRATFAPLAKIDPITRKVSGR